MITDSTPDPDDFCLKCGELQSRHTTIVRGPDGWACYLDGERPDDDDLFDFDDAEVIDVETYGEHHLRSDPADLQVYYGPCDWPADLTGQHRPEVRTLIAARILRDDRPDMLSAIFGTDPRAELAKIGVRP